MANSYTPAIGLAMPAVGDTGWATPVNGNCSTLDGLAPVGGLAVRTKEVPSASLNVAVAAGNFVQPWGGISTYAGTASFSVTASQTNYLYLTNAGTLTANTTGWPTTAHVRLAKVVAGASTITTITDGRLCFPVVSTASAQPTMGSATAGASYGTNEQTMLQAVYNAVRTLGLGT